MRIYAHADEQLVHLQTRVRAWARAGFLIARQRVRLEADLACGLRRTNLILRGGIALFTGLIVLASVLLAGEVLDISNGGGTAALTGGAAAVCYAAAEYLVRRYRLYRHGAEEVFAASAVCLAAMSISQMVWLGMGRASSSAPFVTGLLAGAAGGFWLFARFGFRYAAVGAAVCAALVPFHLHAGAVAAHLAAAAVLASVTAVAAAAGRRRGIAAFARDELVTLEAASLCGLFIVLNLRLHDAIGWPLTGGAYQEWRGWPSTGLFYWTTFAATCALPAFVLWHCVRRRERVLIDAGLAMAVVALCTVKAYVNRPYQPLDSLLLGALLMGSAILMRRWLDAGPGASRAGFTAARLLDSERDAIRLLGMASAAFDPRPAMPAPSPSPSEFQGGQSGGGGGGAGW